MSSKKTDHMDPYRDNHQSYYVNNQTMKTDYF